MRHGDESLPSPEDRELALLLARGLRATKRSSTSCSITRGMRRKCDRVARKLIRRRPVPCGQDVSLRPLFKLYATYVSMSLEMAEQITALQMSDAFLSFIYEDAVTVSYTHL